MYSQMQNFHNHNSNFNDNLYFNPQTPQEICPRVWLGPYDALLSNPEEISRNFWLTIISKLSLTAVQRCRLLI